MNKARPSVPYDTYCVSVPEDQQCGFCIRSMCGFHCRNKSQKNERTITDSQEECLLGSFRLCFRTALVSPFFAFSHDSTSSLLLLYDTRDLVEHTIRASLTKAFRLTSRYLSRCLRSHFAIIANLFANCTQISASHSLPPVMMILPINLQHQQPHHHRYYDRSQQNSCCYRQVSLQPIPEDSEAVLIEEDPQGQMLTLANKEREARGLPKLRESQYLNVLAEQHANDMADQGEVGHSVGCVKELQIVLQAANVGENVQSGESVVNMHWETMRSERSVNRHNILSSDFTEFGCAFAESRKDGKVYTCQLFRSKTGLRRHSRQA